MGSCLLRIIAWSIVIAIGIVLIPLFAFMAVVWFLVVLAFVFG
jgi:hypothetical protein